MESRDTFQRKQRNESKHRQHWQSHRQNRRTNKEDLVGFFLTQRTSTYPHAHLLNYGTYTVVCAPASVRVPPSGGGLRARRPFTRHRGSQHKSQHSQPLSASWHWHFSKNKPAADLVRVSRLHKTARVKGLSTQLFTLQRQTATIFKASP